MGLAAEDLEAIMVLAEVLLAAAETRLVAVEILLVVIRLLGVIHQVAVRVGYQVHQVEVLQVIQDQKAEVHLVKRV